MSVGLNLVLSDIILNSILSIVKSLLLVGLVILINNSADAVFVGIFLLLRRNAAFLANMLQLGVSQALIYFVPKSKHNQQVQYFSVALLLWLVISILLVFVSLVATEGLSDYFYEVETSNRYLVLWTLLLTSISVLDIYVRSVFLSRKMFITSWFIELFTGPGVFLAYFLLRDKYNLNEAFIIYSIVSCLVLLYFCFYLKPYMINWELASSKLRQLLGYGWLRGIAVASDTLLILVPVWMIKSDLKLVGSLITAFIGIRMLQLILYPISLVVTVNISGSVRDMRSDSEFKKLIVKIFIYSTYLVSVLILVFLPIARLSISFLFSGDSNNSLVIYRCLLFLLTAAIPYSLYLAIRSVTDVIFELPYNFFFLFATILNMICINSYLSNWIQSGYLNLIAFSLSLWLLAVFYLICYSEYLWHIRRRLLLYSLIYCMILLINVSYITPIFPPLVFLLLYLFTFVFVLSCFFIDPLFFDLRKLATQILSKGFRERHA